MMTNLGTPDRPVHRAPSDACPRCPVGEARVPGNAQRRGGPRDQQSAGLHRQQPGSTGARYRLASDPDCHVRAKPTTCWRANAPKSSPTIDRLNEECDFSYIRENLDKILGSTRQGVKRVAEIVHNLRGFARLDRAAVDQIDIHEADRDSALEMIRGRLQRRRIILDRGDKGRATPGFGIARSDQPGLPQPAGQRHAGDRVELTGKTAGSSSARGRTART